MRTPWHDIWGCARGPAARLAPQIRIVVGALLVAVCLVAPALTPPGASLIAAATLAWFAACRPPRAVTRAGALLGLALFLPCLLLTPLIHLRPPEPGWSWSRSLEVPASMFVRGLSGMLVALATVTTLSAGDLREGLIRLPVPRVVSVILLQIIHQTMTLADETRHVAGAMAVRGAAGGGRTAWRVLSSLPQVWLPRVLVRAESVAAAMELRGYCDAGLPSFRRIALRAGDGIALALALGLLGTAAAIRWGGAL